MTSNNIFSMYLNDVGLKSYLELGTSDFNTFAKTSSYITLKMADSFFWVTPVFGFSLGSYTS